jgi:hypothetical protein
MTFGFIIQLNCSFFSHADGVGGRANQPDDDSVREVGINHGHDIKKAQPGRVGI